MPSTGGLVYSNNALHNGEPRKEAMVYEIFQISSCLSNSYGWLLVSFCNFDKYGLNNFYLSCKFAFVNEL